MENVIVALIGAVASIVTVVINARKTRSEVRDTTKQLKEDIDKQQNETIVLSLKNNIQGVYAMYRGERAIPLAVWSGICEMYDDYTKRGGNTYIHDLFDEMKQWDKY